MPHSKGEIDTGRRVGQWTYWHDDGTKWKEGGYQDGKKDGVWLEWYYGGQLKSEQTYKASIITPSLEESWIRHGMDPKEGSVNTWHKNGGKNYQGAYLDGKRHGKWTYWDLNGNKTAERYYKKGKISQEVDLDKDETTLGVVEKTSSVNKDDQPGTTSGFSEGVNSTLPDCDGEYWDNCYGEKSWVVYWSETKATKEALMVACCDRNYVTYQGGWKNNLKHGYGVIRRTAPNPTNFNRRWFEGEVLEERWNCGSGYRQIDGRCILKAKEPSQDVKSDEGYVQIQEEVTDSNCKTGGVLVRKDYTLSYEQGCLLNNLKEGLWTTYWKSGLKAQEENYSAGLRHGRSVRWHNNGNWKIEQHYESGKLDGPWTRWHLGGRKEIEGSYVLGKKEGKWVWFDGDFGESDTKYYLEGKEVDKVEQRLTESGTDTAISDQVQNQTINGKKEGKWTELYSNGMPKYEGNYVNGLKEGQWTYLYVNGRKREQGNYRIGHKDGEWITWRASGEVYTKKQYYSVGAEKTKEVIEKTSSVNKDDQPGATSGFFEGVTAAVKWLFTPTL